MGRLVLANKPLILAITILTLILCLSERAAARDNLTVVIINSDPDLRTFDVSVSGTSAGTTYLGRISKSNPSPAPYSLPVKNGDTLTFKANFPGSAIVDSQPFTVQAQTTKYEFDVSVTGGRQPDATGFDTLFSKMGTPNGFPATPIVKAVGDLLGGIALIDPDAIANNITPTVIHTITIQQALKAKPVDPATIHFEGTTTNVSDDVTSDVTAKAGVTLSFLGSWQVGFSSSAVNKFTENVVNLGLTDATPTWDFGSAIDAIKSSTDFKLFCGKALAAGKNSYIIFIDSLYGVQTGEFSTNAGDTVDTSTSLTGNVIVSGDAAYSYASTYTSDQRFADEILNADGSPYNISDVCTTPKPQTVMLTKDAFGSLSAKQLGISESQARALNAISGKTVRFPYVESLKARLESPRPVAKVPVPGLVAHALSP